MTQDRKPGVYRVKVKWEFKNEITEARAYWTGDHWRFVKHSLHDHALPIKPENLIEVLGFLGEKEWAIILFNG